MLLSLICAVSFAITLINYSILCRLQIEELNWKVKETFYALLVLMVIILARLFLDIVAGKLCNYFYFCLAKPVIDEARLLLEFVTITYILAFNIVLFRNILKSTMSKVNLCKDCLNIPFYIAVLWIVFERFKLSSDVVDAVLFISALAILFILVNLFKYIRLLPSIIEPANLQPSLMAYLVFMMFYIASVLANIYEKSVAPELYIVSFCVAVFSMVLMYFEFRRILSSDSFFN